jgi:molybdopterin-guanine dinucleotide biosynthesis protein A
MEKGRSRHDEQRWRGKSHEPTISRRGTHAAIEVIAPYVPFFKKEEAEHVIAGSLDNTQIAWIVSDEDVHAFLAKMHEKFSESLSDTLRSRLEEALGIGDSVEAIETSEEDTPF